MARILTVHGTFAGGPTEGSAWWQKTSPFHKHLGELVEAEDGPIEFEPVHWSGLNSERARRKAGQALARRTAALERAGERYAVIGHSHGGSVIASSLLASARARRPLPGMSRWISVGTPFIETRKEFFLFSRLGIIGKSVYVALLTAAVLFIYALISAGLIRLPNDLRETGLLIFFLGLLSSPFWVFNLVTRIIERQRLYTHSGRTQDFASAKFRPRWLSLWHGSDEAVQGLKSLKTLKLDVFARDFAAPAITMISVFATPLLILWFATSPGPMRALVQYADQFDILTEETGELDVLDLVLASPFLSAESYARGTPSLATNTQMGVTGVWTDVPDAPSFTALREQYDTQVASFEALIAAAEEPDGSTDGLEDLRAQLLALQSKQVALSNYLTETRFSGEVFSENIAVVTTLLWQGISSRLGLVQLAESQEGQITGTLVLAVLAMVVILAFELLAVALVVTFLTAVFARAASWLLARLLNPMTMGQIRSTAYGSDTLVDYAVDASSWPTWFGKGFPPLPDLLGDALERTSDAAIGRALPKFRDAVQSLTATTTAEEKADLLSNYLTWDELIHTSYFRNPQFRKLVAYAIATSDGFRPTAAFRSDPEFDLIADWHDALIDGAAFDEA